MVVSQEKKESLIIDENLSLKIGKNQIFFAYIDYEIKMNDEKKVPGIISEIEPYCN